MIARRRIAGGLALAAASLAFGCGSDGDEETGSEPATADAEWSYEGATGPDRWAELADVYRACGEGSRQSPIDLHSGDAEAGTRADYDYEPTDAAVRDSGHSIEYELEGGGEVELDGRSFELLQAHFHAPAEHLLDGERLPLELHLVHRAKRGDLTVVGVLAEEGEADPVLEPFVDAIETAAGDPEAVGELDPVDLLPEQDRNLVAYSYLGSLTTPPCTENVRWLVVEEPIEISSDQLAAFTAAYEGNARPAQALNSREALRESLRPVD